LARRKRLRESKLLMFLLENFKIMFKNFPKKMILLNLRTVESILRLSLKMPKYHKIWAWDLAQVIRKILMLIKKLFKGFCRKI